MPNFPLGTLQAVWGSPNRAVAAGIGLHKPNFVVVQPMVVEIVDPPSILANADIHWGSKGLPFGPPTFVGGAFFGVTHPPHGVLWAVGCVLENNASFTRNLIFRRSGQVWEHVPCPSLDLNVDGSPIPPGLSPNCDNRLNGVSGTSAKNVWAVGITDPGGGIPPCPFGLILHWDGMAWSLLPILDTDFMQELHGVVAVEGFITCAVGYVKRADGHIHTYVIEYDGVAWKKVISEDGPPGSPESHLLSVTAAGGKAWAAGYYQDPTTGVYHALILERESTIEGAYWRRVIPLGHSPLKAISASSEMNAWAVGDGSTVMHWNGAWHVLDGNKFHETFQLHDWLEGVHAIADDDVWIVGSRKLVSIPPSIKGALATLSDRVPLVVHWNGKDWKAHAGPVG